MTITVNTKAYNADVPTGPHALPYNGPAHGVSKRDQFILNRQVPQASKTYSGTARAAFRLVRTLDLTDALTPTGLATIEVTMNFPVGSSSADQVDMVADARTGFGQTWALELGQKQDLTA